jgi:hypothetical protein
MKSIKNILAGMIAGMVLLGACRKDSDIFIPYNTPLADTSWVALPQPTSPVLRLMGELATTPLTDNISPILPTVLNFPDGLQLVFPDRPCVLPNGSIPTANIKVEVLLLKKKGDLVRNLKPTTSNGAVLESGGVVYLKLTSDGQELSLAPGKIIKVRWREVQPTLSMVAFFGATQSPATFNWTKAPDSLAYMAIWQGYDSILQQSVKGYDLYTKRLNWLSCDYYVPAGGAVLTKVNTYLPIQFTNANTAVFVVFKNIRSVVHLIGDPATKTFKTENIPTGQVVKLVSLSKIGDKYYWALKETTITPNSVSELRPEEKTFAQIQSLINDL